MTRLRTVIARNEDAIMQRWYDEASHAVSARGFAAPALMNIMPRYLAALGSGEDARGYLESHFATRLRQGFHLAEIVDEIALLGRCIVERCFALPSDERPTADEIDQLHTELHRVATSLTEMFDAHMREDEQTEKRYLRLLRDVANAGFHSGSTALRAALGNVLDLVMDAMDAQSAAIMVRDREQRLITAATSGAEPLEEYAADVGAGSFAESVAEREQPTSLWDVASTELDVSDGLRSSGIHSLLGMQLYSRNRLFGVIYVGIADTRTFTARERRRLEALAEQLATHLDISALFAELDETIVSLRAERTLRERFVSVLAHDLRGPLSAVRLGAELLSRDVGDSHDLAIRILRGLDRMDRMIRDLLDASRIRAGERLPLRLGECDLCQIAHEVADELREQHGDRFIVTCGEDVHGVWSADDLRRALWNLGLNAVKYGASDASIELAVRRTGDGARASVHNWGAPITPEDQQHLFDPFARTRAAVESGKTGWGLGLVLVRGCAEAHGGAASVTSTVEDGTTFTIEIPLDARPYQNVDEDPRPQVH
jgi:signal transduction histidine kinase